MPATDTKSGIGSSGNLTSSNGCLRSTGNRIKMDAKFHPAMVSIKTDDLERFRALVRQDPTVATSRSSTSHPTLLQCLVLSGNDLTNKLEMARILVQAGAELNGPLGACG